MSPSRVLHKMRVKGRLCADKQIKKVMPDCCEHYRWGDLNKKGAEDAINGIVLKPTLNEMENKSHSRAGGRALLTGSSRCALVLRPSCSLRWPSAVSKGEG